MYSYPDCIQRPIIMTRQIVIQIGLNFIKMAVSCNRRFQRFKDLKFIPSKKTVYINKFTNNT